MKRIQSADLHVIGKNQYYCIKSCGQTIYVKTVRCTCCVVKNMNKTPNQAEIFRKCKKYAFDPVDRSGDTHKWCPWLSYCSDLTRVYRLNKAEMALLLL